MLITIRSAQLIRIIEGKQKGDVGNGNYVLGVEILY